MTTDPDAVDAYLAAQPEAVRPLLAELRATLRRAFPGAEEKVSYGMPALVIAPRRSIYYAAWTRHIGVYPVYPSDDPIESELAPYRHGKDTLRFPLDRPVPYDLIERVARRLAAR